MQPKVRSKKGQIGKSKGPKREFSFPLEKENFMIIGAGIVLLIIGYFLMNENSVNGFLPTVVSPVLLVAGYCIVIPYGILKKPKSEISIPEETSAEAQASNVKTS